MKKRNPGKYLRGVIVALLALCMLLSMMGCDSKPTEPTNPSVQTDPVVTTQPTGTTAHTHKYTVTVTKEATCTEAGTKTFTCDCSDSYTEDIPVLSHSYKDATCTAPKTCSVCGATEGEMAEHSWKDATCTAPKTCSACGATEGTPQHSWKAATCTAPKTCSVCGATEGSVAEHNYQNGTCTGCGDKEIINHLIGTGSGYAVSSNGAAVNCYQISASELLYVSYTAEKPATGYYVFREYNGTTYYAPAPSWGWISISDYTISGRTVQLQTGPETLELELISANQYKVTKGTESIPTGLVFTFGVDMCDFMGHLYERSCENDVICMYCSHFKCAGLGHEYGTNDICFRCFAAQRPSDASDSE